MQERRTCPQRLVEHCGNMPLTAAAMSESAGQANPRVGRLTKQSIMAWVQKGYIPEMYALAAERVSNKKVNARAILKEAEKARRRLAEQR